MKILLDTCTFLWVILDESQVSKAAREAFVDPSNEVFLSAVSVWEIAVKHSLGKLALPASPDELVSQEREAHGIQPLALDEKAALLVGRLPLIHKDPFDRMLMSQALNQGMTLLTPDPVIRKYAVNTLW